MSTVNSSTFDPLGALRALQQASSNDWPTGAAIADMALGKQIPKGAWVTDPEAPRTQVGETTDPQGNHVLCMREGDSGTMVGCKTLPPGLP